MPQRIEDLRRRFAELERKITDPEVLKGDPALPSYLQEHGAIRDIIDLHNRMLAVRRELEATRPLLQEQDPEMKSLAAEEMKKLEKEERSLRGRLILRLSVEGKDLGRDILMEIRPGVGGEEAALFAGDLLKMYRRYADARGWKLEVLDAAPTDLGGFKEVVLRISGKEVYPRLRFEGGAHRVQRVPETESQGRIHTSAATIAVLPEAEEVEVDINPDDLEITAMHSRGPGGQSVNTASSAVRIVHKPTGIMVRCDVERSQRQNKASALKILRTKLLELERSKLREEERDLRMSQIGSGDRSDRIRTYNFPQNRVTDHRLEGDDKNYPLDRVIQGDLDPIIERLSEKEGLALLEEI